MSETIESTAIAVTEETQQPAPNHGEIALRSAFDIKPQVFQAGLDRRKKNRKALITWIQEELVEGVDWGRIHVVKKTFARTADTVQTLIIFRSRAYGRPARRKLSE